jgi:hypothetical protein
MECSSGLLTWLVVRKLRAAKSCIFDVAGERQKTGQATKRWRALQREVCFLAGAKGLKLEAEIVTWKFAEPGCPRRHY